MMMPEQPIGGYGGMNLSAREQELFKVILSGMAFHKENDVESAQKLYASILGEPDAMPLAILIEMLNVTSTVAAYFADELGVTAEDYRSMVLELEKHS